MVKKQLSKVFFVHARARTVSHKLLRWDRHLRIFGLLGSASNQGFEICHRLVRFLCAVEKG